jgi:UDP-glucose-4-epimerase GalE
MKILVTGGAGYIGSHVCKALSKAGMTPVTVDSLERGHREAVKWGPLIEGNVKDSALLVKVIRAESIEAVMHFAAYCYVGESVKEPKKYEENNLGGTQSLLKAMRECKVKAVVFSSTCAVYGNPIQNPMPETHPLAPINPYGESKRLSEIELKKFSDSGNGSVISLRYFNAAGADPEGELSEEHDPETHLIPLALKAALTGSELLVFGKDYETKDGTCVRDYIHVNDLASAHIQALNKVITEPEGHFRVFNLGIGKGFSVFEVIAAVEKVTGKKIKVKIAERRAGDPSTLIADNRFICRELKWMPQFTSLESMVETAFLRLK